MKQRLRRGRKYEERNEDPRVEMNILGRQALPDPPANEQQPSSSQSDVLLVSGDVTSTCIPFPRHYVTALPGRDSSGYGVPVRDSDDYGVPVRDSNNYEEPIRDSYGYEDTVHDTHCANQEPLYSEIQDGEDN